MQILCCRHYKHFSNNWQDRWPLLWHDGRAVEALSFKRLSVTNFASGWMPLIYVGEESQRAAVSPEMPRRVNCILLLVTVSKTHTHTLPVQNYAPLLQGERKMWKTIFHPPLILHCDSRVHGSHERAKQAELVNGIWFLPQRLPLSYGCMCLDRRNEWMIEQ